MKNKLLKKIMALTIIGATLLTALPTGVSASWKQDSKGWWNTEGNSYSRGWKKIDSKWYYFDQNGYMAHNTIIDEYYINSKGIAVATTNGDIPIKIPSNWMKLVDSKEVTYIIDGKAAFVYKDTDTFGCAKSTVINAMKSGLASKTSNVEVSEKNYNGKNATCMQYTVIIKSETMKGYSILFLKNNKLYCFNIISSFADFDNAKQQLEDMINFSLVL